nr:hypothetical protein [Tanacetum cinerariifolium]GEY58702.1 hypothetical protein [Tanacetum cinerariifolium]
MANENVPAPTPTDLMIKYFHLLHGPTKKGKKTKPHVIPYSRFTKLIIYYLGRHHNIHQRSGSSLNLAEDDLSLGNLKMHPTTTPIEKWLQSINEELRMRKKVVDPTTKEALTGTSAQPRDDTFASVIRETPSLADAEIGDDTNKVISEGDTKILNIDPGKTPKSRPPLDDDKMDEDQARSDLGKSHVALVGLNPELMHDDFVATVYPKVHESLKFLAHKQVILEDPQSSSRTLSSMKTLDETYTFGDHFFNDKSTKYKPEKYNVDAEVMSMVIVSIHQASTLISPLSTPIIDLSPPKLAASPLLPTPYSEQPVKDVPIPNNVNISYSEDTNTAHLSKIKTRPDWLKPLPAKDRPRTLKPDWIIPLTDLPEAENNWVDALAKLYKDPEDNKLLSKTGDMGSFIKRIGKKKAKKI